MNVTFLVVFLQQCNGANLHVTRRREDDEQPTVQTGSRLSFRLEQDGSARPRRSRPFTGRQPLRVLLRLLSCRQRAERWDRLSGEGLVSAWDQSLV